MRSYSRIGRLQRKSEFSSVFLQSRKVTYSYLIALYRLNQLSHARLGIIVKKRLVKSAVKRNLIRRIIKESFRHHQANIKGLDIVVLLRSEYSSLSLPQLSKAALRNDIDNLWQRLIQSSKL